jgi:hypothetical protein
MRVSLLIHYLTAVLANRGDIDVCANGWIVREVAVEPEVSLRKPNNPEDRVRKTYQNGNYICLIR